MALPHAAGTPAPLGEALRCAPFPGLVVLVAGLSTVVPTGVTHRGLPSFLVPGEAVPHSCKPRQSWPATLQAPAATAGTHPTSCPSLLGASRAHPKQVPLPWGFPQQGCPCVPSVTHGPDMLGGAVADRHGHSGARQGNAQPTVVQRGFVWHGMAQHGLALLGLVGLSPAWPPWLGLA